MSDDPFERRIRDFLAGSPAPDEPASLHDFLARVPAAHPRTARRHGAWLGAVAASLVAAVVGTSLLATLVLRGTATPNPSGVPGSIPPASAGPSAPASIAPSLGPTIGTPTKLGEHAGTHTALATTAAGAAVSVTPAEIDANGARSCPASVLGSVSGTGVTWTDAPAAILALAGTSDATGPIGLGGSSDCAQTVSLRPDGTGGFTTLPVNVGQLSPDPAFLATKPGVSTSVAAWQADALKGGFVFWSGDAGRTWQAETSVRPAGWDAAGLFWSIAEGKPGGPLELVSSQGPGFSGTRTGILLDTTAAAIEATAVFRDRILVARSSASVLSVSTNGGAAASVGLSASSLATGTRFVAALGKDLTSGGLALAISTDGVQFVSAPLPDEFAASDPSLLHVAALDDRVVLTEGPAAGPVGVWSVPVTGLPSPPPNPTPIPTLQVPTQPPAQVTSTWTKVTLPAVPTTPSTTFGGPDGGLSALPSGGFVDFVPVAVDRTVILTSPDGSTWTQTGEITGRDALGVTGPVAFNGHIYVALGAQGGGPGTPYAMQSNGAAWVSTDLAHWTKAPSQAGLGGAIFHGIAAGSAAFVAIGDSEGGGPTVWTSTDGLHWGPVLVKSVFPFDLSEATGIATTPRGLVIVGRIGEEAATWSSPDGRTWTVHSPLPRGSGFFNGIAGGPAGFVSLVGRPSAGIEVAPGDFRAPVTPWTSADGVTWQAGPSSPALFGSYGSIVGAPGGYVAVGTIDPTGTEHLWTSTDGTTWVPVAGVDLSSGAPAALVSDGHHVLLSFGGELLVSDGVMVFAAILVASMMLLGPGYQRPPV